MLQSLLHSPSLSYRKLTVLIACVLLLLLTGSCKAENGKLNSVVLAVEDSWPPYSDSNGKGIANDLVNQAYAAVGIEVLLKVSPYARVLNDVESGRMIGGFNVTRQTSTEKKFLFGDQALLSAPASFYFSPNNKKAFNYNSISDIPDGSSVGIIIDYEYGNSFDQHKHRFKQVYVSNQTQIINMLKLNRIDTGIMFDEVARDTLKSMNLSNNSIQKGPQNHISDVYVAFSRAHKYSQFYANKLDEGITKIKENGQYQEILLKSVDLNK